MMHLSKETEKKNEIGTKNMYSKILRVHKKNPGLQGSFENIDISWQKEEEEENSLDSYILPCYDYCQGRFQAGGLDNELADLVVWINL